MALIGSELIANYTIIVSIQKTTDLPSQQNNRNDLFVLFPARRSILGTRELVDGNSGNSRTVPTLQPAGRSEAFGTRKSLIRQLSSVELPCQLLQFIPVSISPRNYRPSI